VTVATTIGPTEAYLKPWTFPNAQELQQALAEYTALLDGLLVQRYGPRTERGEEPPTPQDVAEYERTVWRQRSTIDLAMEELEPKSPTWHRLIDMYYRHGLSMDPKGWLLPMTRLGYRTDKCPSLVRCSIPRGEEYEDNRLEMPKCRQMIANHCQWNWSTFQVQVTKATEALYLAIGDRAGRTG